MVAVERVGSLMVELSVRLPHLAAHARPGQFAQLRCGDGISPLLRRPFSVAWVEGEICSFVLAPVGLGTRRLAALRSGDRVDVLGPLGRGFSPPPAGARVLCVSGGLGCAPFPLLLRSLAADHGRTITVINGAATAGLLYPSERFTRGAPHAEVVDTTVDGSRGHRGLVTTLAEERVDAATVVYACGPNAMLAALERTLQGGPGPAASEVSLETPMGCGYGTCLGCALPVRSEGGTRWALCCQEGPVMAMGDVDWKALMALPPAHVA